MSQENEKKEEQTDIPTWLHPEHDRKEPYTDEELDVFVEQYLEDWVDVPEWKNVVDEIGLEAAKQTLKDGIKQQGNMNFFISQSRQNLN